MNFFKIFIVFNQLNDFYGKESLEEMTYYIKEALFSHSGKYSIKDHNLKVCFETCEQLAPFSHSISLKDNNGKELISLMRLRGIALPEYKILHSHSEIALVKKSFKDSKSLSISCIHGTFNIKGDYYSSSYTIVDDAENILASIKSPCDPFIISKVFHGATVLKKNAMEDPVPTSDCQEKVYSIDILDNEFREILIGLSIIIEDLKSLNMNSII
ncbi:LURP-one-related family protein [Alloiococcus sp. CFN-8]|uniref:LURP-one-related family protein n=1 Tax=Alloiococcus sp. CFN-8 TaxID=3416081 RepID=UPI003CFB2A8B